jgi:hypothetical protein
MKKLLLTIFLFLAFCPPAQSQMLQQIVGGSTSSSLTSYCNSGTTCGTPPQNCGILCEDLEGSTACFSGYTSNCRSAASSVYKAGTDTVTFAATASGTYPCATTANTYVAEFVSTTGGNTTGARWTAASDLTVSKGQFYFNVKSITLANGSSEEIFEVASNTPTVVFSINILPAAGVLYLTATSSEMTTITSSAISTNTWYRVGWEADEDANTFKLYLNGVQQGSTATNFTTATAMRRYYINVGNGTKQATAYDIQYDNIAVDGTTAPSACSN